MINEITWYPISRKAIPGVLLGMEPVSSIGQAFLPDQFDGADAALGIVGRPSLSARTKDLRAGCVLVVDQQKASDLFAWLSVYAEDAVPVSQFCRVMSYSDWKDLGDEAYERETYDVTSGIWASVVVGEMLAHSESDIDVPSIPLSRAAACYSNAMARSAMFYDRSTNATRETAERLRVLDADARFTRKVVRVDLLTPVWALAGVKDEFHLSNVSTEIHPLDVLEVVNVVLHSLAQQTEQSGVWNDISHLESQFARSTGLSSDVAEQRVRAFEDIAASIFGQPADSINARQMRAAVLAGAAFIVGRGTSHIGLLSSIRAKEPLVTVWFGLFAGLAGPRCWDTAWVRAVRGVEKQLRHGLRLWEPANADLCWIEYDWMRKAIQGQQGFSALPKLNSRVISIEVVPGAACQFRLNLQGANVIVTPSIERPLVESSISANRLKAIFNEIAELAAEAQRIFSSSKNLASEKISQESLFDSPNNSMPKTIRNRRQKK